MKNKLNKVNLSTFLTQDLDQVESWWGDRLFGRGFRMIVGGKSGSRKSFFTLGMILKMAQVNHGQSYIGLPITNNKKILYMNFEINENSIQERLRHMTRGMDAASLKNIDIINTYDFKIDKDADAREFINLVLNNKYDVVALDCMYKMHNKDENSELEIKPIIMLLDMLVQRGVSVILVHHHGKHANVSRGTSVITDWADTIIGVNPSNMKIYFNKVRNGEEPSPISVDFCDNLFFDCVSNDENCVPSRINDSVIIEIMRGKNLTKMSRVEIGEELEKLGIAKASSLRKWKSDGHINQVLVGKKIYYELAE